MRGRRARKVTVPPPASFRYFDRITESPRLRAILEQVRRENGWERADLAAPEEAPLGFRVLDGMTESPRLRAILEAARRERGWD